MLWQNLSPRQNALLSLWPKHATRPARPQMESLACAPAAMEVAYSTVGRSTRLSIPKRDVPHPAIRKPLHPTHTDRWPGVDVPQSAPEPYTPTCQMYLLHPH